MKLAPLILLLFSLPAISIPCSTADTSLKFQPAHGYRFASLPVPKQGRPGFTLLTNSQLGLLFTNTLPAARILTNHNLLNGAGLAAGDYDNDGFCDLYFCNLNGRNALYRNRGSWQFEDRTLQAAVSCPNQASTGATFADLNGDGALDLLVNSCGGPNACFLNNGHGQFINHTTAAGLLSRAGSTTLALADIDRDGDLDLYVANYGENTIRSGLSITTRRVGNRDVVSGRYAKRLRILDGKLVELGEPDLLYLNNGHAQFQPVSWTSGAFLDATGKPLSWVPLDMGLSAMFRDVNDDGAPDLYVCNDFQTPDRFWINDGHGRFRLLSAAAMPFMNHFAMTVDFTDINRDGYTDFLVADMRRRSHLQRMTQTAPENLPAIPEEFEHRPQIRRNTLWLNRGDGTFAEIAHYAGLDASDWTWAISFVDVDLDGYEDLLAGTGHAFDTEDKDTIDSIKNLGAQSPIQTRTNLFLYPPLPTPNAAFRNRGNLTFQDASDQWGWNSKQVSHGIALADLDNDGDLDVAVNCLNAPPLIYRNDTARPRLAVSLKGLPPNTHAIGAKLTLANPALPRQSTEIICGGHYLSSDDTRVTFAATDALSDLEILWPNGQRTLLSGLEPNCLYEISQSDATPAPPNPTHPNHPDPLISETHFEDWSSRLNHQTTDTTPDDFLRNPLLSRGLNQLGPALGWLDLDDNGQDELIVATGAGGQIAAFNYKPDGTFHRHLAPALATPSHTDQMGFAAWTDPKGATRLLVAIAPNENTSPPAGAVVSYATAQGAPAFQTLLPSLPFTPGPLAIADTDADGDLDLFVGGRTLPGRYPEPAPSRLYRNDQGQFVLDQNNSILNQTLGLVTSAIFSDLTGDGWPELLLATEWGPIRLFLNRSGRFQEATPQFGLDHLNGWWSGITTGDFNGDGLQDILAANWGLNSEYRASSQQPVLLYYGDLDGNQTLEMFEAQHDNALSKLVPLRNLLSFPPFNSLFSGKNLTCRQFGQASVQEWLGPAVNRTAQLHVNSLASTLFLHRTNHFQPLPLPTEAQWSPASGIAVADFDGDGAEDAFLSQNFSGTHPSISPQLSGRGLWLKGNGQGHFTPVPGQLSGLTIYGDQRGCAVADFDHDGRVDLAVAQHAAPTKLFHNSQAKPGLRVHLNAGPQNPHAVGATARLKFKSSLGPARELHAGSGYWSQDSFTLLLAMPEKPLELWVRWPGGTITTQPLPDGATDICANFVPP